MSHYGLIEGQIEIRTDEPKYVNAVLDYIVDILEIPPKLIETGKNWDGNEEIYFRYDGVFFGDIRERLEEFKKEIRRRLSDKIVRGIVVFYYLDDPDEEIRF